MKVKNYYPVTLTIDGEEIKIRIKRMNLDEAGDFQRRLVKTGTPAYERFVSRAPSGPEQERKSDGFFVIPMDEIVERKLSELTDERRADYEAADDQHEKDSRSFLVWVFETFVTVESGILEQDKDKKWVSVTEGIDLLRVFGARLDVLSEVVTAVRTENSLDEEQKKILKSPTASPPTLVEPDTDQPGPKPAPIAENADNGDSAKIEPVTSPPKMPSGSTETSGQTLVPS